MNFVRLFFLLHVVVVPILASRQLLDVVADSNYPAITHESRNTSSFLWVGRVDAYLPNNDNWLDEPIHQKRIHQKGLWGPEETSNSTSTNWQPYLVIGLGEFLGNTVRGVTGQFPSNAVVPVLNSAGKFISCLSLMQAKSFLYILKAQTSIYSFL